MWQGKRGAISVLAALALLGLTPIVAAATQENVGYSDTVALKLIGHGPDPAAIALVAGGVVALAVLGLAYWKSRRAGGSHPA